MFSAVSGLWIANIIVSFLESWVNCTNVRLAQSSKFLNVTCTIGAILALASGHSFARQAASAADAVKAEPPRLKIGGDAQFRYVASFSDGNADSNDDFTHGFVNTRTRLNANARFPEHRFTTTIVGDFVRATGNFTLVDAVMDYDLGDGFMLRFGQEKLPFSREFDVSHVRALLTDFSVPDTIFRQDRSQMVRLAMTREKVRTFLAFSDGARATNTDYTSPLEADAALTGRAELRFGEAPWSQFVDMTSFRSDKTGALLGAAVHWQQAGRIAVPTGVSTEDADLFAATTDFSVDGAGWNMLALLHARWIDTGAANGGAGADQDYFDWGGAIQGGVFLADATEIFARGDYVEPDSNRPGGTDPFSSVAGGFNYYLAPASHVAKFTAQLTYFLGSTKGSSSIIGTNTLLGLTPSAEDGEIAVILQVQLIF